MLLGSHLAGAAIETSMLGAAHSLANPLTARFGVTHGVAVGLMLPHVIRFNGAEVGDLYRDLSEDAERLSARVAELLEAAGSPQRLGDCGVGAGDLDALAEQASHEWTAQFNPRPVARDDLRQLYESAL